MSETPGQEIRRLARIMAHVEKLSPAGRTWLLARLLADAGRPDAGICGEAGPTLGWATGQPQRVCEFRSGHTGWHGTKDGMSWGATSPEPTLPSPIQRRAQ